MIESFIEHCANGVEMKDGVIPNDIPPMEFTKPGYRTTHYSWISDGVTYVRGKDRIETRDIVVAPNRKHLVVLQSPEKYGPDNLLILRPDGTEEHRLKNPYPGSPEFRPDATHEFLEARVFGNRILALIAASWYLPNRGRNAEPVYSTFYDCDTWEWTPLELRDSKDL